MLDCLIVGAGAAGIAAARDLQAAGRTVQVLEARDRAGGRAWTVERDGLALDLGAEWLHSADRNPLVGLARGLRLPVLERQGHWAAESNRARLGEAAHAQWDDAFTGLWRQIEGSASAGVDRAVAELVPRDSPLRPRLEAVFSWVAGAALAELSTLDLGRQIDSDVNWRLPLGMGRLLTDLAAGVPIAYGAAVGALVPTAAGVEASGDFGRLQARSAILAVPTALLAAGQPKLPADLLAAKAAAAAALPLGANAKLFLKVEGHPFGPLEDRHYHGRLDTRRTGAYHLHDLGRPLVECYYGGAQARDLERAGLAEASDFAIEELAEIFGQSVRRRLSPLLLTGWGADPWARGAYSHARPGQADARRRLAEPLDGRFFFAGEASSLTAPASCHGAWESGQRAAREVLAALA